MRFHWIPWKCKHRLNVPRRRWEYTVGHFASKNCILSELLTVFFSFPVLTMVIFSFPVLLLDLYLLFQCYQWPHWPGEPGVGIGPREHGYGEVQCHGQMDGTAPESAPSSGQQDDVRTRSGEQWTSTRHIKHSTEKRGECCRH